MVRPVAGLPSIKNGPVWVACNMNWLATKPTSGVPATNHLEPQVRKSLKQRFEKIGKGFPLQRVVKAGALVGRPFSI